MRLEQLKYFAEVVKAKSINKAAHNLYMTQPALSKAINALEDEIDYKLLKRSNYGVILPAEGKKIYEETLQILQTIAGWSRTNELGS